MAHGNWYGSSSDDSHRPRACHDSARRPFPPDMPNNNYPSDRDRWSTYHPRSSDSSRSPIRALSTSSGYASSTTQCPGSTTTSSAGSARSRYYSTYDNHSSSPSSSGYGPSASSTTNHGTYEERAARRDEPARTAGYLDRHYGLGECTRHRTPRTTYEERAARRSAAAREDRHRDIGYDTRDADSGSYDRYAGDRASTREMPRTYLPTGYPAERDLTANRLLRDYRPGGLYAPRTLGSYGPRSSSSSERRWYY